MIKYILTTEKAVVNLINNEIVKMSQDTTNAIKYNTIGEAMKDASQVNKVLGHFCCKVISIEI